MVWKFGEEMVACSDLLSSIGRGPQLRDTSPVALVMLKNFPSGNEQNTENLSQAGSSSEEFVAKDDNNVCTAAIRDDEDILEFVQS
ncbi:hypothetical protein TNCV_3137521 [Trichonephila clavipes]|nr:hypothetical protein TNCV_3137521 [Trichonephila clavipes]